MGVDWKVYNISKDIKTLMSLIDEKIDFSTGEITEEAEPF